MSNLLPVYYQNVNNSCGFVVKFSDLHIQRVMFCKMPLRNQIFTILCIPYFVHSLISVAQPRVSVFTELSLDHNRSANIKIVQVLSKLNDKRTFPKPLLCLLTRDDHLTSSNVTCPGMVLTPNVVWCDQNKMGEILSCCNNTVPWLVDNTLLFDTFQPDSIVGALYFINIWLYNLEQIFFVVRPSNTLTRFPEELTFNVLTSKSDLEMSMWEGLLNNHLSLPSQGHLMTDNMGGLADDWRLWGTKHDELSAMIHEFETTRNAVSSETLRAVNGEGDWIGWWWNWNW